MVVYQYCIVGPGLHLGIGRLVSLVGLCSVFGVVSAELVGWRGRWPCVVVRIVRICCTCISLSLCWLGTPLGGRLLAPFSPRVRGDRLVVRSTCDHAASVVVELSSCWLCSQCGMLGVAYPISRCLVGQV